jgi:hypothetical protein
MHDDCLRRVPVQVRVPFQLPVPHSRPGAPALRWRSLNWVKSSRSMTKALVRSSPSLSPHQLDPCRSLALLNRSLMGTVWLGSITCPVIVHKSSHMTVAAATPAGTTGSRACTPSIVSIVALGWYGPLLHAGPAGPLRPHARFGWSRRSCVVVKRHSSSKAHVKYWCPHFGRVLESTV